MVASSPLKPARPAIVRGNARVTARVVAHAVSRAIVRAGRLASFVLLLVPCVLSVVLPALYVLPGRAGQAMAAPPPTPFAAAVLPFEDLRRPGQPSWLGSYLRERIAAALVRAPGVAVLSLDGAAQWQRVLGLHADDAPSAAQLERMHVTVVVQGTVQEVLGLVEIQLHARTAGEDLLAGERGRLRVHLEEDLPPVVLGHLLESVRTALLPGAPLTEPHPPEDWEQVRQLYEAMAAPIATGDREPRPARVALLRAWENDPALGGRAHEAQATLLLEQALLFLQEGAARQAMLEEALRHASAALRAEPLDTSRQALKGELHYFLKQHYEAKTEASVARLRNPLEGLAFVVLALAAGLSTGEATEHLTRAQALDPYLRTAARPQGSAPFQGGILEPSFRAWEQLRAGGGLAVRRDDYEQLLGEGIAHFEQGAWEQAERLLGEAARREDNDHVPWLYLNRILIEIGHPAQAVTGLRRLAAGNPQEPDVLHYLGVALEDSGEPEAALEAYRKALLERPDDARSLYRSATAHMALKQWQPALTALRRVLQAEPEHADAWLQMGIVQMQLQDWTAAEPALERALALKPDSTVARERLATVRGRLGPARERPEANPRAR